MKCVVMYRTHRKRCITEQFEHGEQSVPSSKRSFSPPLPSRVALVLVVESHRWRQPPSETQTTGNSKIFSRLYARCVTSMACRYDVRIYEEAGA